MRFRRITPILDYPCFVKHSTWIICENFQTNFLLFCSVLYETWLDLFSRYKNTAIRLAKLMNDTYMTGLEKSVWWIEYVIRNNGTKELRNPAAKLPFYQYYALDVIGLLLTVTIAMAIIVIIVLSRIWRLLLVMLNKKTTEKHKKHWE